MCLTDTHTEREREREELVSISGFSNNRSRRTKYVIKRPEIKQFSKAGRLLRDSAHNRPNIGSEINRFFHIARLHIAAKVNI